MKQVLMEQGTPIKIWSNDVEEGAVEQLRNVAKLPFIFKHVAAMPDVHWGHGATVGTVIATDGAIVPSAVGVDIGCGMTALCLGVEAKSIGDLALKVRENIEKFVPVGFNAHKEPSIKALEFFIGVEWPDRWKDISKEKAKCQLGTLGGGNHFIEICTDERGILWAMLHSGSRGLGKMVADIHMKAAQKECERWHVQLPHKDLAFLPEGTPEYRAYFDDLQWCQAYAKENRRLMMGAVTGAVNEIIKLNVDFEDLIDCHHNYATMENHYGRNILLTRKGAIRARVGDKGIIPGSMGAKSYIVEGLGNPESFNSASHGAGRRLGRKEAMRQFTVEDFAKQTEGIECRKDQGVLDEIPSAYKDIDVVMANQEDLVKPIHTLKQLICVKG